MPFQLVFASGYSLLLAISSWNGTSLLVALASVATPVLAQDEAMVDAIAGVLAREDARRYDGPLLQDAANHPDALVRRRAALAMGRIGDPRATPTLLRLLSDQVEVVRQDAAFALMRLML